MTDEHPDQPPRGRFQFSLWSLFVVTFLVSIAAAALGGMLRSVAGEIDMPAGVFVVMAAGAPMAVMIALSLLLGLVRWFRRRR